MTHEVVPLAVRILSRQAMEDRHFIHKTAELAVGTRIATGFEQQHLEAGTREMSREWSTTGARADHDVVKLCSAHFISRFAICVGLSLRNLRVLCVSAVNCQESPQRRRGHRGLRREESPKLKGL